MVIVLAIWSNSTKNMFSWRHVTRYESSSNIRPQNSSQEETPHTYFQVKGSSWHSVVSGAFQWYFVVSLKVAKEEDCFRKGIEVHFHLLCPNLSRAHTDQVLFLWVWLSSEINLSLLCSRLSLPNSEYTSFNSVLMIGIYSSWYSWSSSNLGWCGWDTRVYLFMLYCTQKLKGLST